TRLANLLMQGTSLEYCCAELGIRRPTACSHLRQLFKKTHVQRQSQLVSLLLKSIGLMSSTAAARKAPAAAVLLSSSRTKAQRDARFSRSLHSSGRRQCSSNPPKLSPCFCRPELLPPACGFPQKNPVNEGLWRVLMSVMRGLVQLSRPRHFAHPQPAGICCEGPRVLARAKVPSSSPIRIQQSRGDTSLGLPQSASR